MSLKQGEDCYLFNGLKICLRSRELTYKGRPVAIETKAWDCLTYLLRHRDRAVSKEELREVIWQNRPLSDTVISRCVMKARRAIRDDGQHQTVIRTVPGYGYRFTADVVSGADEQSGETETATTVGKPRLRLPSFRLSLPGWSPRPRYSSMVVVLLVFCIPASIYFMQSSPARLDSGAGERFAVLPVNNATGDDSYEWMELGLMSLMESTLSNEGSKEVVPLYQILGRLNLVARSSRGMQQTEAVQALRDGELVPDGYVIDASLESTNGIFKFRYDVYLPDKERITDILVGEDPVALAKSAGLRIPLQLNDAIALPRDISEMTSDPVVQELYRRGSRAAMEGDYGTAQHMFRTGLGLDTDADWIRLELAGVETKLGNWARAHDLLEQLLSTASDKQQSDLMIPGHNTFGELEWRRGNFTQAREHFNHAMNFSAAMQGDQVPVKLLINLAMASYQEGKRSEAMDILKHALTMSRDKRNDSDEASVLRALGRLTYLEGRLPAARDYMRKAQDILHSCLCGKEAEVETLVEMGKIHRALGENGKSETYLEHALSVSRKKSLYWQEARSLIHMAHLKMAEGKIEESSGLVQRGFNTVGEGGGSLMPVMRLQRALIHAYKGNIDQAAFEFEQVRSKTGSLEDDFSGVMVTLKLGRMYLLQDKMQQAGIQARNGLSMATELNSRFLKAFAYRLKANIAHADDKLDDAEMLYREALAMARELKHTQVETEILTDLAHLCLRKNKLDQAEVLLSSIENGEHNHNALVLKAVLKYRQGKYNEAITLQSRAKELADKYTWSEEAERLMHIFQTAARTGEQIRIDSDYVAYLK